MHIKGRNNLFIFHFNSSYLLKYIFFLNLGAFPEAYDTVSDVLASCQLASFLEVIHPLIGIVRTGALAPFMQVDIFCTSQSLCL